MNSIVTLEHTSIDQYQRTLAEIVTSEGVNINRRMAEIGLTIYYPFQSGCTEFRQYEAIAKSGKLGVWSDSKFELPWEYRKRVGIGYYGKTSTHKY